MSLLVPNQGDQQLLSIALGATAQEDLILKLFTNNVVPAKTDTGATYTEAAGNGYAAANLPKAGWSVNATGVASYAQQTINFSGGPVTVYGYFIVGATSGKLYWAEAFAAPANIPAGGGAIKITPTITLN